MIERELKLYKVEGRVVMKFKKNEWVKFITFESPSEAEKYADEMNRRVEYNRKFDRKNRDA